MMKFSFFMENVLKRKISRRNFCWFIKRFFSRRNWVCINLWIEKFEDEKWRILSKRPLRIQKFEAHTSTLQKIYKSNWKPLQTWRFHYKKWLLQLPSNKKPIEIEEKTKQFGYRKNSTFAPTPSLVSEDQNSIQISINSRVVFLYHPKMLPNWTDIQTANVIRANIEKSYVKQLLVLAKYWLITH